MNRELVAHRDPACTAGFTATTGPRGIFDDRPAVDVELRCWTCGTRVALTALTPATNDPETDDYRPPAEHKPYLAASWGGLEDLAASCPVEKVGQVYLHAEWTTGWRRHDAIRWLVADKDGNVLGEVAWYLTARSAHRYAWGLLDGVATGDGCATPQQAARALAKALHAAAGLVPA